jgi:hypothetical protein
MRKSLRSRLVRLQQTVVEDHQQAAALYPLSPEQWLQRFLDWDAQGVFDHEPDFPLALAFFRSALEHAQAQAKLPFDPSADSLRDNADLPHLRLLQRSNQVRFPAVQEGLDWLIEMAYRAQFGIPPLTEAEFRDLATWFEANCDRLRPLAGPSEVLLVGEGKRDSLANLRYRLRQGPRACGAGIFAQKLRWLRACCASPDM